MIFSHDESYDSAYSAISFLSLSFDLIKSFLSVLYLLANRFIYQPTRVDSMQSGENAEWSFVERSRDR